MTTGVSRLALVLAATFATPAMAETKAPQPVMVYALAWDNCLSVLGYQLEMADSSNYSKARDAARKRIAEKFPNAKGTRAGSSKFDFGDKAGAVSVIEIDNSDSTCKTRSVLINFGIDEADALARSKAAAKNREYKILEQRYFVTVTTAPKG